MSYTPVDGPELVTCPACNGLGGSYALINYGDGCRRAWMRCYLCHGQNEGRVTPEKLDWKAQGEAMRDARRARKVGLTSEARRLGLSPVELSQMEHGAIRPIDYDAELERMSLDGE